MKLISRHDVLAKNKRHAVMYKDDKGKSYFAGDLAKIAGIAPAAMRERIKNWGFGNPKILQKKLKQRGKGRKKGPRGLMKIPITPGDLEGKYTGKKSDEEIRKILDGIPSSTEYESQFY